MPKSEGPEGPETKLPTKKVSVGKPTIPTPSSALANAPGMSRPALDERQANINVRRKPGGPPKEAPAAGPMANAPEHAPDVPPTECAEPPAGDTP